jgi:hypothetical protein
MNRVVTLGLAMLAGVAIGAVAAAQASQMSDGQRFYNRFPLSRR